MAGSIAPGGGDAPGLLRASRVTMGPDHRLVVRIRGLIGGWNYDRLGVRETARIDGAKLALRPTIRVPRLSEFRIVTNAAGTFAGLPEGATIPTAFGLYSISYRDGDAGRDVVVTAL